jgi:transcriptional regulator with XRE-family HTH domain
MNYEKMIGDRIIKLRGQKDMTTTHLAKRVGVSQAQISRLEHGKQGFRSSTLVKIAEALGVKPAYFWIEDEAAAKRLAGPSSK